MFVIIVSVFLNIYVSQGSAKTYLQCAGIYNDHINANCLQSVPVKKILKI